MIKNQNDNIDSGGRVYKLQIESVLSGTHFMNKNELVFLEQKAGGLIWQLDNIMFERGIVPLFLIENAIYKVASCMCSHIHIVYLFIDFSSKDQMRVD